MTLSSKCKVLVVDDDVLFRTILQKELESSEFLVEAVSSGEAAIKACKTCNYDMVVLDYNMPGLNGLEVATQLNKVGTPFLFISSFWDDNIVDKQKILGSYGYLVKQGEIEKQIPHIKTAIEKAKQDKKIVDLLKKNSVLVRKLNALVEDERRKISLEIHDELNSVVVAIKLDLIYIKELLNENTNEAIDIAKSTLGSALAKMEEAYNSGKSIINRLRPETIDSMGLVGALDNFIQSLNKHHEFDIHFEVKGDIVLPLEPSIAVYRIVQEALSNSIKHAKSHNIHVSLSDSSGLVVTIKDDGIGFDVDSVEHGVGLMSMEERAHSINCSFELQSSPDTGTTITLRQLK